MTADDTGTGGLGGDDRRLPPWAWRAAALAVVTLWVADTAGGVVATLRPLLITVLVSFLLACTFEPPVNALARRGVRRGLATFVLLAAVVTGAVAAVAGAGAVVAAQYDEVVANAPEVAGRAVSAINGLLGTDLDPAEATERARELLDGDTVAAALGDVGGGAARAGGYALAGLLIVFYLIADGPRARRAVCSLLPPHRQHEVLRAWDLAMEKAGGWLFGRAVLAVITATAAAVAFTALGVDYPLPLAVWVGLATHLIPVVGSWMGAAVPLTVALADSPGRALAVAAFLVAFNYIRNLAIAPRVVRVTLRIHPAVGFVSVIGAGMLFGPAVALVALPTTATVQAFASTYLQRHTVVDSHLTDPNPPRRRTPSGGTPGDRNAVPDTEEDGVGS